MECHKCPLNNKGSEECLKCHDEFKMISTDQRFLSIEGARLDLQTEETSQEENSKNSLREKTIAIIFALQGLWLTHRKAMDVLFVFLNNPELPLRDLARQAGLPRSTAAEIRKVIIDQFPLLSRAIGALGTPAVAQNKRRANEHSKRREELKIWAKQL